MESIISNFEKLYTDKREDNILELIFSIKNISIQESTIEYSRFTENYSKLKYLKQLFDSLDNFNESIFYKPLKLFMEKIDSVNDYYLTNINLDPGFYDNSDIKPLVTIISKKLRDSLIIKDPLEKLNDILIAYESIVKIYDYTEKDYFIFGFEDPDFERQFSHKRKKIK
jgi:hypothetical protein